MRKRPLMMAAVFFIIIEIILSEGLKVYDNKSPSEILLQQHSSVDAVVIGKVLKQEDKDKSRCLYLKNVKIIYNNQIYKESKILAYTGKNQHIKNGNTIQVKLKLENIKGPRNPGNFDEKKYYKLRGISIKGYGENVKIIDDHVNFISDAVYNIQLFWKMKIKEALNEKYEGVLMAVLTGDKSELNSDLKSLFEKNGIGHILAISGLHMSFFGMAVYNLIRKAGGSYTVSASGGVIILLCYLVISGNSISAKRAFVMFIIRSGADIFERTYDMPISLSIGAMALVTLNVRNLKDPGFLLSFCALAGLSILYPCIRKIRGEKKSKDKFNIILPGISITIVSLPVTLYFFYEYPLYSIILNLIIIPLMSLVMFLGLTGSLLSFIIPGKFNLLLKGCALIFFVYEKLCYITSKLPAWRIVTGKIYLPGAVIYYTFLIISTAYLLKSCKKRVLKKKEYAICSLILMLCICFSSPAFYKYTGKTDITMVDVGQGDGIFIKDPYGRTYFVDGGSSDVKEVGSRRIVPFLLSKGIKTIDYCFISHGDDDHKNGIEEILENKNSTVNIKKIVLPEEKFWDKGMYDLYYKARESGTDVYTCDENKKIENHKFLIEFMFPCDEYKGPNGNESSMVFKLKYKKFSMLFTGDLEGSGERFVEKNCSLNKVNVLKTAHHGSNGSTSELFLRKTNPDIAIISCGVNNRYGHPGPDTVKRLNKIGVQPYITSEAGAINVKTNGKTIKVTTFLK